MKRKVKRTKSAFAEKWCSLLWHVMSATGNGYRRPSLKNTGRGKDIRKDKLDDHGVRIGPNWQRVYANRYSRGGA